MENNKSIIFLMGQPGAGKGTQAELLSDKLGLYHFETSKILEEAFKKSKKGDFVKVEEKKYFLENEKKLWNAGILCSPPFVSFEVKEKIKELFKTGEGIIFSGSPRSVFEAENIVPFIEKLFGKKNIRVIFLEIPAEETIYRNSHRRICELMRHPIFYSPETKNLKVCPLDGSKLIKRGSLDKSETIKKRLKEFKERTFPLLELLKKRGLKINYVNGIGSISDVFERSLKAANK